MNGEHAPATIKGPSKCLGSRSSCLMSLNKGQQGSSTINVNLSVMYAFTMCFGLPRVNNGGNVRWAHLHSEQSHAMVLTGFLGMASRFTFWRLPEVVGTCLWLRRGFGRPMVGLHFRPFQLHCECLHSHQ